MTMKEIYQSDDSRMTGDPLSFETKTRDKNIDEISIDDQKKDSDNKDEKQISPSHGISVTVEEFTPCNENVYQDSISERDGGSDLFETVTNVFTDKNVLEYDLPELEVMKDICVDDRTPENDKDLLEHSEDNKPAKLVNQCEMKEDNGDESLDQEIVKASSFSSSEIDNSAKYSLEEYSTQLETFVDSLGSDGNNLTQLSYQIPIEKIVSKGPVESSSEVVGGLDESGKSITFNFADAGQVQCTSSSVTSLDEQSLVVKDKDPDNSDILCANSSNSSDGCDVRSPSDKSQCLTNEDVPAVELNASKWQSDQGEMSFSAVTYSGPVGFSGSLSHRSDASTTSTRSFAFPILQCEWDSSPVRMAEADRRHFRKQKGWRSGLLCCRF
ncbi:hypothetical protein CASFOL_024252 [Castilleja foliolosa]|uniref:18S pre-ribosomal assembly protein gar2-related n=1 Tax=Castilleja foliolosa TaxID=1961234 RepID=A0ABD3CMR4_9LAMI